MTGAAGRHERVYGVEQLTADDARRLVEASGNKEDAERDRQAKLWLDCWFSLIKKVAQGGQRFAHEEDIDIPRTQITRAAKDRALNALGNFGYKVVFDERKVSW